MFVDLTRIYARSGSGGNGCKSFRREKHVPRGGPDGGDGGNGGDVVFTADPRLATLLDYRYQQHLHAGSGGHGSGQKRTGPRGDDAEIPLPVGTLIKDAETGEILADLTEPGQRVVLIEGGRGGRGNARFATPTNRAPEHAQLGQSGRERHLELELKLIADVGLVGHPNAGKSTLLSRISAARPKIADYPFTTLQPNLGIVKCGDYDSFVMADIPGIIEGAHRGKGLGFQFLRHIERTRVLLFMVDVASPNPECDLAVVKEELDRFSPKLREKPAMLVATKLDLLPPEKRRGPFFQGQTDWGISSITGQGLDALIHKLHHHVQKDRAESIDPSTHRRDGIQPR